MRFWLRELAGWVLVLLGLYVFFICLVLLVNEPPRIIQTGPLTLIGIIIFRGGIHLLKVAVAPPVGPHAHAENKERGKGAANKNRLREKMRGSAAAWCCARFQL